VSSPQAVLELGGLALAHAFRILPELNDDELLCPFAIVIGAEGRELIDFEADTQENAVAAAKSYLAGPDRSVERLAFARDGRSLTTNLEYVDAISVSVRDMLSNYECTFSQLYRFSAGCLEFFGPIEFMLGDEADDAALADARRGFVVAGMDSHPTAGAEMASLRRKSLPLPQLLEPPERLQ